MGFPKTLRGLSDNFMEDLKRGKIKGILEKVKNDRTLLLQIRDEYINIFYRGCSTLKLSRIKDNVYKAEINEQYILSKKGSIEQKDPELTKTEEMISLKAFTAEKWISKLPSIKSKIDENLAQNNSHEREFKQLVAQENRFSKISNGPDYFIVDIDCAGLIPNTNFDMMAIKCGAITNGTNLTDYQLVLIKVQYGDTSLNNLKEHYSDICLLFSNIDRSPSCLSILQWTAYLLFKQLCELELINIGNNTYRGIGLSDRSEFILLCANHSPNSTKLHTELTNIETENSAIRYGIGSHSSLGKILFGYPSTGTRLDFRFAATASFMGYGLYNSRMLNYDKFMELLKPKA